MTSPAGLHHAALSVTDIDRSIAWYSRVLGLFEIFRRESDTQRVVVMRFPGWRDTLGFVQHIGADGAFDPARVGLDHLALRVESEDEFLAWPQRFDQLDVPHSGINETPFGGMLHFKDPDGIALALFWERDYGDGRMPPPAEAGANESSAG